MAKNRMLVSDRVFRMDALPSSREASPGLRSSSHRAALVSQLGKACAMKNYFGAHFFKSDSGTTAIEYGLIGALISVVCIAGMILVGNELQGVYNAVSAAITPAL